MSLWKFWNPKHKKERITQKEEHGKDDQNDGSPAFDRQRNRHQMSVSRSGRYKQKHRKRTGILDNPDFVNKSRDTESGRENQPPIDGCNENSSQSDDKSVYSSYLVEKENEAMRQSCQNMEISAL
ncbi:uncharacterized protein LOC111621407 [Centruroides sculpturatus]|uniref:uncharacterized protein LOC111621407 n=1 Tax=Centruroides sculpturatus TaxID=218467 RepID=UPI000C6DFE20|nr:uncharacterized protein LOC111621407 [Centruroides sculpturatus]